MSEPTGRDPEERLPAPRPPSEPAPVERFAAPPSAHQLALTPERSAGIVRQSAAARWVSFLAVLLVVIFVIGYYFYELGVPTDRRLQPPRRRDPGPVGDQGRERLQPLPGELRPLPRR